MKTKFVGWASAHRPDLVGQSPTLQCRCDQSTVRSMPRGFSIARVLLTVLLIIFICFGIFLMMPHPHQPGVNVRQFAQLRSIDTALELFKMELDFYPPSEALDKEGAPYCGAMKLSEAVMGQDLMGVHRGSHFRRDGTDDSGNPLYKPNTGDVRRGPYLPPENAGAYRLKDLYKDVGPFDGNEYVLCDESKHVTHLGTSKRVGMPILYYKADTSKTAHDLNDPNNPENIYDYRDNHALVALGVPGKPGQEHPLFENPKIFYEMTRNYRAAKTSTPIRADTYILLSAGWDGLYGTKDDIPNFAMQWKPK